MAIRILLLLLISQLSFAQSVHNDDIQNRYHLKINDKPYISHTEECTVQKECLNLRLTDQCLIYHNDQWFEFTSQHAGDYFLNIRNQDCRDVRGTQAVIIEGEPCVPESYIIHACVSNGHQDDMYTKVSLEANKTYLVLIDGYLNDYCYFDIDISTQAPDFALLKQDNTIEDSIYTANEIVELKWKMDSLQANDIQDYQILRRHESEKKSKIIFNTPNLRNARGLPFLQFQHFDTLEENKTGTYFYKIIGIDHDSSLALIRSIMLVYSPKPDYYDPSDDYILINLPKSKRGTLFQISIRDAQSDILLDKKSVYYDKLFSEIKLDIKNFRQKGIIEYKVLLENVSTNEATELLFEKPHPFLRKSKLPDLF